ncbi:3-mercaptopyruvate sulfurtransferase [Telmatospirillum sp.]|uniref:3-mercaptopyruvate sulfurtransferase n=1 Tax=Telmatospirillum sp. TaxID=2079197 RepID=UPI00283DD5D4|nr:3-mercaptopyruvate sulfurtransferase [Telmatospirillum sp.]MDR3435713.1 3-mercaptopyruvate sulfurtransferase [Telmatospirillum sp.]
MTYANTHAAVSTEWLAQHLTAPDVRVVDASWFFPGSGRDGRAEYDREHIAGAVYFDINDISDTTSPLPHMVPDPDKFAGKVRGLGLGDGNRIVVYDRSGGGMAAARVWWMFRLFGHEDVSLLDGGIVKWLREGRPTMDLPPVPRERHFTPYPNSHLVRDKGQLLGNLQSHTEQVVDARSAARFAGHGEENWPHKKVGHIPGSLNVPWDAVIDPESLTLLPPEALKDRFLKAGVDLDKPITVTCGSGVSSCLLALSLYLLGHRNAAVYDGSWAEWGLADDTPAATL